MWLSDLSIKRPVFITMMVLVTVVVGYMLYTRMAVDLFPDVSLPIVAVRTVYAGATPQEMETLVTKPIEEAVSSLNYVTAVHSTSAESVSLVVMEFDMGYSTKDAVDEVRQRLASIRNTLPSDATDPDTLKFDPSATPILTFAVADRLGQMPPDQLRDLVDNTVVPRIERVPGVGTVAVTGGLVRQINVNLNLDRIRAQLLTPQQVIAAIKGENLNIPGGNLVEGSRQQLLRTAGEFGTLDEIGNVPLATPRGGTIYLRDVADVQDGFKEVTSKSRLNGQESVAVTVQRQSGTNTVRVTDAVKAELDRIRAERPNLDIAIASDQSVFTRESTNDVLVTLLMGAGLATLVVLLFFGDIRNTLVTVAGLPVIVLGTFIGMSLAGFTLNMISLMALSLSIGMLIDDAIVVRENIFRHMESGEEPRVAASRGTAEIALAVLATTLTIVAVFAPIGFTPGLAGRFLKEFGVTVAIAALISLVEAFTLAPMLSALFFKPRQRRPGEVPEQASRGLYGLVERFYRALLGFSLRRRWVVVLVALVVLGASAAILPILGQSFIADFDASELQVNVKMPPGTTLDQTDQVTKQVEDLMARQPEVANVFSVVGSANEGGGPETAYVKVRLKGRGMIDQLHRRVRPELDKIPGMQYDVDLMANSLAGMMTASTAGSGLRPLTISVQGDNAADLDVASQQVMDALRRVPGIVDIDRSLKSGQPEVRVQVDRPRAADLGITTAQVGATVRALVNGEVASTYRQGDSEYDILVRLREEDRSRLADIEQLPILSPKGALVPLSAVASLTPGVGPSTISRQDRQRLVSVGAGYLGRELGEVTNDARKELANIQLPPGVTVSFSGQAKYMDQAFSDLLFAILLSVIFVYVVLASQFGSFGHPLTIMLALPLSLLGAFLALLATGRSLDMVALIGIILLMGLVTKNSILLVDFTNNLRAQGKSVREAILIAGPIRLRPILMTTLSMIFGMLPTALGYGAGAEVRMPMAIAVIGGLTTSTLLTLLVVPVVYSLFADVGHLFSRRPKEPIGRAEPKPEVASPAG